jgi:hypothetical protein
MNLVEIIMKLIGSGDILGKIASLLGIGQEQAGKAVNAAVPSLLAGVIGSASKPEGAANLANLLSQQEPGLLNNLSGLLSEGANLGTGSSNPLSSLLGGGSLGQIAGALSRFTGIGESSTGKLLGMLSPVVLGAIGKQAKGLDATGLASMLAGQKANVTSALPAGLGSMLSSAVPGLASLLGGASSAASTAFRATTAAASDTARQVESAGSSAMKWLVPLIVVVLALIFLPRMCHKASETAKDVQSAVEGAATSALDSTKFVSGVSDLIKNATEAAATITNETSVATALPKLQEVNTKLADLKSLWPKLPVSAQKAAADTLRPLIAKLREALQPALGLPVVGDKIKPTVDEMLRTLDSFTSSG